MIVRQRRHAWEVEAPAKLNLFLEILGRRPDGFHEVETLLVPIAWTDRLTLTLDAAVRPAPADRAISGSTTSGSVTTSDDGSLLMRYHPSTPMALQIAAPARADNLVVRAAQRLAERAGMPPRGEFELYKRIPAGAGLGGGSSDAAAALLLANAAWGIGYSMKRLAAIAAELGSDVPFFLYGRPAVGRGRGEQMAVVDGFPKLHVVTVVPPVQFMTAKIFALMGQFSSSFALAEDSSTRLRRLTDLLRRGAVGRAGRWMVNRLQIAAREASEWVERLEWSFSRVGCRAHQLTGSGSGYFGIANSAFHARAMAARLSSWNLGIVKATATA